MAKIKMNGKNRFMVRLKIVFDGERNLVVKIAVTDFEKRRKRFRDVSFQSNGLDFDFDSGCHDRIKP